MSAVHIQRAVPARGIPSASSLRAWAEAARGKQRGEITLRIVDAEEGLLLNRSWRGKAYATNVLSFPMQEPDYLGDIVICAEVVAREAAEQHKAPRAHWAHLVVHGVLHLMGHDHIADDEAEKMEALERRVLAKMGFDDPYQPISD
ncbi:MAG: rRNA maturation RNase YbeY [Pseudomonadota bacterium]